MVMGEWEGGGEMLWQEADEWTDVDMNRSKNCTLLTWKLQRENDGLRCCVSKEASKMVQSNNNKNNDNCQNEDNIFAQF